MNRDDTADLLETIAGKYPDCRWKITSAVIDAWQDELASVKPLQADKALTRLSGEFEKRPPTAMAFRRLCYQQSAGAGIVRRCGRAGCPLTLSQHHQHACRFHEQVDQDRDAEVLDRMRAHKLDIRFLFWLEDASPSETLRPQDFDTPDWLTEMRKEYPKAAGENMVDYQRRIKREVEKLVLGDAPLKKRPQPVAKQQQETMPREVSEFNELAEL
jgi:hypothetical protein